MLVYANPGSGLTRAGKQKLGDQGREYKLGVRADKHKRGQGL